MSDARRQVDQPQVDRFQKQAWNASSETYEGFGRIDNVHIAKAIEHRQAGRAVEAIAVLDAQDHRLVARDPDALCARALAHHMAGNSQQALADLRLASGALQWKLATMDANRADVLQYLGQWDEARECAEQAVAMCPAAWLFRVQLAQAVELCGDAKEAEGHFREFMRLAGDLSPGRRDDAFEYVSRIDDLIGLRRRIGLDPLTAAGA